MISNFGCADSEEFKEPGAGGEGSSPEWLYDAMVAWKRVGEFFRLMGELEERRCR